MYAVVRTGGKQYRVQEGGTLTVDRLPGEPGERIELRDVLVMGDGADVTVGAPVIDGARVVGTISEQGRGPKVVVFRYKAKTRSRKKTGHRRAFTRVLIEDILAPGQEPKPKEQPKAAEPETAEEAPPKRRRARKKAEPAAAEPAEATETAQPEAEAETSAEAAQPEATAEAAQPETAEATEPEVEQQASEEATEKPKRRRKKEE